jgi:ferredoxin
MGTEVKKVGVYHERCIGSGNCADVAGKYFDQSDADGTVVVRQELVDFGDEEAIERAVDVCPVSAIYTALAKAGKVG